MIRFWEFIALAALAAAEVYHSAAESRMPDSTIAREAVLSAIYCRANRGRIIWSPSTTLSAMGIERCPHLPQDNYRKMKKVLQELCDAGLLLRRPKLHSHYTMKEVAYERMGQENTGLGGDD